VSGVHRNCDDSLRDLSINLVTLSEAKGLIFDDITQIVFHPAPELVEAKGPMHFACSAGNLRLPQNTAQVPGRVVL